MADLVDNAAILAGYSTLRDVLTTTIAVFEHSGIHAMIGGSASPPDPFIPEFSIVAFLQLTSADAAS